MPDTNKPELLQRQREADEAGATLRDACLSLARTVLAAHPGDTLLATWHLTRVLEGWDADTLAGTLALFLVRAAHQEEAIQ